MSLYSVVHKERKRNSAALIQDTSDSPCSLEHQMNYEDTESEYASELRRQTYLQKIGEHGGYSRNSHHPSVSSVYSTLPHPHVQMAAGYNTQRPVAATQQPRHVRLSSELDLDTPYTPMTTPIAIETNGEGPICASSPKRSVSAFTTSGPSANGSRSNVTTPISPTPPSGGPVMPIGGHLV